MNEQADIARKPAGQSRAAVVALIVLVTVVAFTLLASRFAFQAQPAATVQADAYAFSAQQGGEGSDITPEQALSCVVSDDDGQKLMIADIAAGKPAVVNVWATWCPYCVAEMGDFQVLYEKYGNDVQFVMLDACDSAREAVEARSYVAGGGYTFPVFYDSDHAFITLYNIRGLPTTIVLSPDGQTLLVHAGQIEADRMDATISALAS